MFDSSPNADMADLAGSGASSPSDPQAETVGNLAASPLVETKTPVTKSPVSKDSLTKTSGGPPPLPGSDRAGLSASRLSTPPVILPDAALAEDDEDDEPAWWVHMPSWLASMVLHLILVLILAVVAGWATRVEIGSTPVVSAGDGGPGEGPPEELGGGLLENAGDLPSELSATTPLASAPPTELSALSGLDHMLEPVNPLAGNLGAGGLGPVNIGLGDEPGNGRGEGHGPGGNGTGLELRLDGKRRGEMLRAGGGTPQSEEAVAHALKWLSEHQESRGNWTYQHPRCPKCRGKCENPGYLDAPIAATGMALLPFLGNGQTHHEGRYKEAVDKGLRFLVNSMKLKGQEAGSLWDPHGTMYGHGLATIALCEAYGMTHDQRLREPAQAAVDYIVAAQHEAGGWRYYRNTPGDTSVVGWQLMALRSAQMAYLQVPKDTLRKASYFLDSVQNDEGATYGYLDKMQIRPSTSAIGLLCRMYLGWGPDVRPMESGVAMLNVLGPSVEVGRMRNNMYYNYYATQVMHHHGGHEWDRWNKVMREHLIATQSRKGHEYGSWYFDGSDQGSGAGGRVYCTSMAAMTLEVYYRYMPLYRPQSVDEPRR